MISTNRSGSKIVAASDSDPNAARPHLSRVRRFGSSLACCTARIDEQIGLNKYSSSIAAYWSKCNSRLHARSRSHPSSRNRFSNGSNWSKYFNPTMTDLRNPAGERPPKRWVSARWVLARPPSRLMVMCLCAIDNRSSALRK